MTGFTIFFGYSDGMRIMTSWFSDKGLASAIFSILGIFYSLEYKMNTKKQIAPQKTQSNEKKQIDVNFLFRGLTDKLESDIKTSVDYQIEKKMDSYFKKFIGKKDKPNAKIRLKLAINADKKGLFEGKFQCNLDGKEFAYHTNNPFKNPRDIVAHAFDHLKETMNKFKKSLN